MTTASFLKIHGSFCSISLHACRTDLVHGLYLLSNFLFYINNPFIFKPYNERWWILKWDALNIHKARAPTVKNKFNYALPEILKNRSNSSKNTTNAIVRVLIVFIIIQFKGLPIGIYKRSSRNVMDRFLTGIW